MGSRFRSGRPGSPHHAGSPVAVRRPRTAAWHRRTGRARACFPGDRPYDASRPGVAGPAEDHHGQPGAEDLSARVEAALQVCLHGPLRRQQATGATLGGPGTRRRSVVPGSRFVPAKTGSYTLHITARDGHGKLTTTTSQFLVERAITWSGYSRAIDLRAFTL